MVRLYACEQTVGDRLGKNEKTKVVAKLQKPVSQAAAGRVRIAFYFVKALTCCVRVWVGLSSAGPGRACP